MSKNIRNIALSACVVMSVVCFISVKIKYVDNLVHLNVYKVCKNVYLNQLRTKHK